VVSSHFRSSSGRPFCFANVVLIVALAVVTRTTSIAQPGDSLGPRPNRVGVTVRPLANPWENRDSRLLELQFHRECLGQSVRGAAIGMATVGLLRVLLDVASTENTEEDRKKTRRSILVWMAATGALTFTVGALSACDRTQDANPGDSGASSIKASRPKALGVGARQPLSVLPASHVQRVPLCQSSLTQVRVHQLDQLVVHRLGLVRA
jgi:hypothetical protein